MAGRIQVVPQGLLSLFGLKTTGVTPQVFPDHVQPVSDVERYYLADRFEAAEATLVGAAVAGDLAELSLTQELWRVFAVGAVAANANAGAVIDFTIFVAPAIDGINTPVPISEPYRLTTTAATDRVCGGVMTDLLLGPGSRIYVVLNRASGGATTYDLTLRVAFARLTG